jgi:hypothetical protein
VICSLRLFVVGKDFYNRVGNHIFNGMVYNKDSNKSSLDTDKQYIEEHIFR